MDITKFVNAIKEQLAQNRLEQAIEEMKNFMKNQDYYNEVIIQSARYNDIESQIRMNTVSKIDADIEKNKIRLAVLQIVDNIQKYVIKSATSNLETNKSNKIQVDGSNNIVLQDVNGSTISVNYNDTEAVKALLLSITENQTFILKQCIGNQHKEVLTEMRKIQEQIDKQNTEDKVNEITEDLDEFFREINQIEIDGLKKNLITNYEMLREFEELLIFEVNPKTKYGYEHHIKEIKKQIEENKKSLIVIK